MQLFRLTTAQLFGCALWLFAMSMLSPLSAQVSGTVFRDFNASGVKDNTNTFNEPFVANLKVYAYSVAGGVDSTATDVNGAYSFSGLTLPVRIEFGTLQTGDFSAPYSSSSGSSVQFYAAASTTANFGVHYPQQFCQANPNLVTPCYVNGDPLQNGANNAPTLIRFPYNASGEANNGGTPDTVIARTSQIGATWALAYQKTTYQIFSAAFLKRHTGFGPLGIGGIYKTDVRNGNTSNFVDLNTIGIAVGTDPHTGLQGDPTQPSYDEATFDKVGKIGIGGMDISDDGKNLFVVNLNLRTLNKIFINNPAVTPMSSDVSTYPIPNPNCRNGDFRPFAVKYYRDKVYVGVVCSNETAHDTAAMTATVYEFDPILQTFTVVLQYPLTFRKGKTDEIGSDVLNYWNPWSSNTSDIITYSNDPSYVFYPQCMLSDIEFDVDGTMIISGMDRFGHQWGWFNYYPDPTHNNTMLYETTGNAQVYRAAKCNGSNTFQLENNAAVCNNTPTAGANNNKGPGGGVFYYQNIYDPFHDELSYGGLSLLAGSNEIVETALDPIHIFAGGVLHMNNTNGQRGTTYEIYLSDYQGGNVAYGKSNGLGDLKLLCDAAPLEIGNRIWADINRNGIQDAGEIGLNDIIVELYENGNQVAFATTANGGQYYFTNANVTSGLKYNTAYEIHIATAQTALGTRILTTTDAGNNDAIDNDGIIVGANIVKAFTTGNAGENNHSYDFGFQPQAVCNNPKMLLSEFSNNFANSNVLVFDFPSTQGISAPHCDLGNGAGNDGLVVDNARHVLYSVSGASVKVYDYTTNMFTNTYAIPNFGNIYDAAMSLDGNYLFLGSQNGVLKMDVTNGNIVATLAASTFGGSGGAWGVAVHPTTGDLYVARGYNSDGSPSTGGTTISSISPSLSGTPMLLNTVSNGASYIGLTFNESDQTLWAILSKNSTVSSDLDKLVHLSAAGAVLNTYDVPGSVTNPYGGNNNAPFDIAFSPDGDVYFTSFYGPCVSKFAISTSTFSTYIPYVPNTIGKGLGFACVPICQPLAVCTAPTLTSVATVVATCSNGTANNNAAVAIRGIAGMAKYSYGTNGTTDLYAANAIASTADSIRLDNLANPMAATTYTFRMYAADTICHNDTTIVLNPVICPQPCSIIATFTQGSCNNNGTTITAADDYFTINISNVAATNGGVSGKYEVVYNNTVLNIGGTAYGTAVTVGTNGSFHADGTTTYTLKVRDLDSTDAMHLVSTCETTAFTTAPTNSCSTLSCPTQVCVPVIVTRRIN